MIEKFEIGSIVEGKVTGIKPFGAFVALDENQQGLVHISQIAHEYIKDINERLSVGDVVKVKILSIDEETGKISLSIKETQPVPQREERKPNSSNRQKEKVSQTKSSNSVGFNTFEDKLQEWLKQSNQTQVELNKRNKR